MRSMRHTSFKAIADPTRRDIISMLVEAQKPLPITSITGRFQTSRQAVTKHIKVLHAAGIVEIKKQGRERYCSVNAGPLQDVYEWVSDYRALWNGNGVPRNNVRQAQHAEEKETEDTESGDILSGMYRTVSGI